MDPRTDAAEVAARCGSGRFRGMIQLSDTNRDIFNEVSAGVRQPDAAGMTLEQKDARFFPQRLEMMVTILKAIRSNLRLRT